MGSTGTAVSFYANLGALDNGFGSEYQHVLDVTEVLKLGSNLKEWIANLNEEEIGVIRDFVASEYGDINDAQYNIPWEQMGYADKYAVSKLHDALSKFELNQGIVVNRATSFRIFGAKDDRQMMTMDEVRKYLKENGNTVQNDGFMSFSTRKNGYAVEADGLVIHLKIPPSKGAGAYLGNNYGAQDESEFLVNTNTVMKFDSGSMRVDDLGNIHITAEWLGRSEAQTISPTYKGKLKKG